MPPPVIGLVGTPELRAYSRHAESLLARGVELVALDPMELGTRIDGTATTVFGPSALDRLDGFFAPVAGAFSIVQRAALIRLEATGCPTINRAAAKALALDKVGTSLALAAAGIPQPHSIFVSGSALAGAARAKAAAAIGYPLVMKGRTGARGAQVFLCRDADALEAAVARLNVDVHDGIILQQFYPEADGRDFRVIVLDGRSLAVTARWSGRRDEFRAAMPGYVATTAAISSLEAEMAVAAVTAIGLDFGGVDLMRTANGPRVIEINYNPGLARTEAVTGVDIAGAVADALLARIAARA